MDELPVVGSAEKTSQPIELDPNLPEGWSGFSKVEYDENGEPFVPENTEKPWVSKPIELSTEIPEGFQGQPKVEYDEKGNPYVPEIEQKKQEVETERQQAITEATKPVVELELLGDENEAMDLILDKAKGDKDGGRAKVRQHERIRAKFQALKELIDCV